MNDVNIAISKVVLRQRKKSNLSQEKLAELAGVHRTYISQIERGLKSPTIPILMKIGAACGISISELIREMEADLVNLQNKN